MLIDSADRFKTKAMLNMLKRNTARLVLNPFYHGYEGLPLNKTVFSDEVSKDEVFVVDLSNRSIIGRKI